MAPLDEHGYRAWCWGRAAAAHELVASLWEARCCGPDCGIEPAQLEALQEQLRAWSAALGALVLKGRKGA